MAVVSELIHTITQQLTKAHADTIERQQDAWWILEYVLGSTEAELIEQKDIELTDAQQHQLTHILTQHITHHEPLQYLLGTVPFGDLTLFVEPPVLIPRQETEEWTIMLADKLLVVKKEKLAILDLCSGSGCIALYLAHMLPKSTVVGVDISTKALALAQKNAKANGITNVTFVHSDLFEQLTPQKYDLIVSNPPYISESEWKNLEPNVTQWEDQQALVSGSDGLDIIRRISSQARTWLALNEHMKQHHIPQLVIEIGYKQGQAAQNLLMHAGFSHVYLEKDLEGKDRIACAEF